MINLLELTKKQIIVISWAAVAIAVAGFVALYIVATTQAQQLTQEAISQPVEIVPAAQPAETPSTPADVSQEAPQTTEPATNPQAEPAPVQDVKQAQGGHIPFTNEPVTPGQPETYVDTVGQCPFYEMAGPKGCYPPSDIVCNADWTICEPKQ